MATVFGAQNVRISHSSKSETKEIMIHPIKKGDFYIDTSGFNDSEEHNNNIRIDFLSKTSDFNIFLFEHLPPTSIYVRKGFTSDELNEFGIFKGSEPERILAKYESLMKEHLEHPIYLNLKKVKCSK